MKRLLLFSYTFVLMNWAAMKALYCYLRGSSIDHLWHDRTAPGHGAHRA
jgi:hypothetical protein